MLVGIQKDGRLIASTPRWVGYRVLALNFMSVARYRELCITSGSKSDAADTKVAAEFYAPIRTTSRKWGETRWKPRL